MSPLKAVLVYCSAILWFAGSHVWAADPNVHLQFGADGKFKIVQFTDHHWELYSPSGNQASLAAMASVLDYENPDLVVLTGDVIPTFTGNISAWQDYIEPMQTRGIPWAVTLGNHDGESWFYSRSSLMSTLSGWSGSLVERGPTDVAGEGNYVFTIKDSTGQHDATAIYCLDSQESGFDSNQIEWYRDQSAAMTAAHGGSPLPSLMFFHIPLPEYDDFGTSAVNGQIGQKTEDIRSNEQTGEMFAAIHDMADVQATFVGHDHGNDYALFYDEVCLAYGRKTGPNSHGHLPHGGRVIELAEGMPGFDSWIRVEDGSIDFSFHYQRVSDTILGDANQDGVVDAEDAARLALNWKKQTEGRWSEGDFNLDGAIDERDASILASHWGMSNQPTVPMTSVPEPSVLVMLLALAATLCAARRRTRDATADGPW